MNLRDAVRARLIAHDLKPTPQRVQIGMMLLAGPIHLSAEQILTRLRETGNAVSKATVYNTLSLFTRYGIVREVAVDPNRLFYDSTTGPHHHFFNEDTGELHDIDAAELDIRGLPALPPGTEARSVEVIVRVRNADGENGG